MDLPRQYSYKPRIFVIVWCLFAGLAWIAITFFEGSFRSRVFSLAVGFTPIMMGLLGVYAGLRLDVS